MRADGARDITEILKALRRQTAAIYQETDRAVKLTGEKQNAAALQKISEDIARGCRDLSAKADNLSAIALLSAYNRRGENPLDNAAEKRGAR